MPDNADITRGNRRTWDTWSDNYQGKHGTLLNGPNAEAWGLWRRPERQREESEVATQPAP